MPARQESERVFEVGLDTWLVATGQVPAPDGAGGMLRVMASVLLGENGRASLTPEMAERLLPIGPWKSPEEASRDPEARARLRDMTSVEKDDLRRALFGARKYLARSEGQEIAEEEDPRAWLYRAALGNVVGSLERKGWTVDVTEDHTEPPVRGPHDERIPTEFRAIVEATHPRQPGPLLRFIVDAQPAAKYNGGSASGSRDLVGFTLSPSLDGGCVSCVRAQGCEQGCPFLGRSFCQLYVAGIGHVEDRGWVQHTLGLGKVDF